MNWRSLLFVPGSRPDRFAKAMAAGADAVCIDLEDAVPPHDKDAARASVLEYLQGGANAGVRINAIETAWGAADIAALAGRRLAFAMIPKAPNAETLQAAYVALGQPRLVPVVESAEGLLNAWDICAAPGVAAVLFGAVDYAADIGAELTWESMLYARGALAAACGRARKPLMDVPHLDVDDDVGLIESTKRARALGFSGRACIHPRQIAGVHAAFAASDAEIARARRVLEAFDAASGGAALLDGKLIELPVVLHARRLLANAGGD